MELVLRKHKGFLGLRDKFPCSKRDFYSVSQCIFHNFQSDALPMSPHIFKCRSSIGSSYNFDWHCFWSHVSVSCKENLLESNSNNWRCTVRKFVTFFGNYSIIICHWYQRCTTYIIIECSTIYCFCIWNINDKLLNL